MLHRGNHFRAVAYIAEVLPAPNIAENTNFQGKSYFLGRTRERVQLIEEIKNPKKSHVSVPLSFWGTVQSVHVCTTWHQGCGSVTIITDPDPTYKIITDPDPDPFFLITK